MIVINSDDEEGATEGAVVNKRRNIDSSIDSIVTRAINLGTADLSPTPQLDLTLHPSISDPSTLLYKRRLPDEDLCHNQMTVEVKTFCNEVCGLLSGNTEDTNNEGKGSNANNHNEYKNMKSAIDESKYEHTDADVIRIVEVRGLTLQNERGTGREGVLRGRSDVIMTCSNNVEGLYKGDDYSLLDRLRIEENLS